jgi:hypothetical protein
VSIPIVSTTAECVLAVWIPNHEPNPAVPIASLADLGALLDAVRKKPLRTPAEIEKQIEAVKRSDEAWSGVAPFQRGRPAKPKPRKAK